MTACTASVRTRSFVAGTQEGVHFVRCFGNFDCWARYPPGTSASVVERKIAAGTFPPIAVGRFAAFVAHFVGFVARSAEFAGRSVEFAVRSVEVVVHSVEFAVRSVGFAVRSAAVPGERNSVVHSCPVPVVVVAAAAAKIGSTATSLPPRAFHVLIFPSR